MNTAADPTVLPLDDDDGVGVASDVIGMVVVTCVGVTWAVGAVVICRGIGLILAVGVVVTVGLIAAVGARKIKRKKDIAFKLG